MKTKIISIGNSKGLRIPKPMLEDSDLDLDIGSYVELVKKKGEIRIIAVPHEPDMTSALLSEAAFSDWLRPEEEAAWASYQPEQ